MLTLSSPLFVSHTVPLPLPYLSPLDLHHRRVRRLLAATVTAMGFLLLTLLDRWLFFALRLEHWDKWQFRDWEQALRAAGYLPLWVAVGLILLASRPRYRPNAPLTAAPLPLRSLAYALPFACLAAGGFAELCKIIVRRHRPTVETHGAYLFDWFGGAFAGRGLGFVSSHAAVAFGAAFLLWRYSRPAGGLLILVAVGCSVTRMLAGAHFATDIYGGAVVAWFGAALVWRIARYASAHERV